MKSVTITFFVLLFIFPLYSKANEYWTIERNNPDTITNSQALMPVEEVVAWFNVLKKNQQDINTLFKLFESPSHDGWVYDGQKYVHQNDNKRKIKILNQENQILNNLEGEQNYFLSYQNAASENINNYFNYAITFMQNCENMNSAACLNQPAILAQIQNNKNAISKLLQTGTNQPSVKSTVNGQ